MIIIVILKYIINRVHYILSGKNRSLNYKYKYIFEDISENQNNV